MRGLMPCILAGIAVVVAMDILAPPLGLGLATVAQSATDPNQQIVDRTRKGRPIADSESKWTADSACRVAVADRMRRRVQRAFCRREGEFSRPLSC
jgi:hypothetical protein